MFDGIASSVIKGEGRRL